MINKATVPKYPPLSDFVEIYFSQKGVRMVAMEFYSFYKMRGWKTSSGTLIRDWKEAANEWIFNHHKT